MLDTAARTEDVYKLRRLVAAVAKEALDTSKRLDMIVGFINSVGATSAAIVMTEQQLRARRKKK